MRLRLTQNVMVTVVRPELIEESALIENKGEGILSLDSEKVLLPVDFFLTLGTDRGGLVF